MPVVFVVLACVAFIGLLFLGSRLKQRNWGAAYALVVFALFLACAACGGGGGGGEVVTPTNGIMALSNGASAFNAAAGFDETTGLGSVNVQALINAF